MGRERGDPQLERRRTLQRHHVRLSHEQWLGYSDLKAIFDKFDFNGDGSLDRGELQVALKVAVGVEFQPSGVQALIDDADTDGTGTIDFDEFLAICRR